MLEREEIDAEISRMLTLLKNMPESNYFYGVLEGMLYSFALAEFISDEEYEIYMDQAREIFEGDIEGEVALLEQRYQIVSKQVMDGVHIDPVLPEGFDNTPNDQRPDAHRIWINRPYIGTTTLQELEQYWIEHQRQDVEQLAESRKKWLASYPDGTCYTVYCLDGETWDKPSEWGYFTTLEQAMLCAKQGPAWLNKAEEDDEEE